MRYWLSTRPYTLIDAVNRAALATGSMQYAMAGADADYNGHRVLVYFNDYRGYWLAEYTWAGRQVLCRGDLGACLRAAKQEYDRGAKGAMVVTDNLDEAGGVAAEVLGYAPYSEDIEKVHLGTFQDDRYREVAGALWMERHTGVPAIKFLIDAKDKVEYDAKVAAFHDEKLARQGG